MPWLTLPAGSEGVTFHQGLTMRSGLSTPLRSECADPSLKGVFASISAYAPPGHIWVYSSSGFSIGAAAIEEIEKRPFEDVLHDRFLDPMGLTNATFDATVAMAGDHAASHTIAADGSVTPHELNALPHCAPGVDCSVCEEFRANAGLYLSANDLGRMVEHIIAQKAPFDSATVDGVTSAHGSPGFGEGYSYGHGIFAIDMNGKRFFFAGTEYAGVTGFVAWEPESAFGVVLIANAMPLKGALHPDFQRETIRIAQRFVDVSEPDLTTPASTWGKYVGKYGPFAAPYEVTLSPTGKLEITNSFWEGQRAELEQGGNFAYSAGDSFHFADPVTDTTRVVTFYAGSGDGDAMQYMVDDSETFLVAPRLE